MTQHAQVLVFAVAAVAVLHTLVPDHWLPIALLARQHRWSHARTARTAFIAGFGHTVSTLAIGVLVWFVGLAFAVRFGNALSFASGLALTGFGGWVATASWIELRRTGRDDLRNDGVPNMESVSASETVGARMSLLLILGSSPMIEGIPVFFAAANYGIGLLATMSVIFGGSTIATYMILCSSSRVALQRLTLGRLERYGEVLSGSIIAIIGLAFLFWPMI